jgi:alkanesulfonate monooxygenase SsuD/methylene tetrahydromethanopterin reductase-like flavin-dependent oxidoreductase (luciferase family)
VPLRWNRAVRIGVSLRSSFAVDARTGALWMVERAAAASAAGLDSLFVGDHHVTARGAYYQNTAVLGRLLAEWNGPRAGALFLLPLWHPVLVAEQIGTLASLTGSRFVMQTAIGAGRDQFAGMGVPLRGRAARFEAAIDAVRRLLAGETVTARVGDLDLAGAAIGPVPPEPVEIWIGGDAEPAIERAARLGDAWLANAHHVDAELRAQAGTYLAACERLDRTPVAVAVRREVHVGADERDAAAVAEPVVASGYRGFRPEALTYGSVEAVADRFRALAAMGYTDVIVRQLAAHQHEAVASIERLAAVQDLVRDI